MRILACFFVIFNHTGTRGFFLFSLYEKSSIQFWVYLIISIFCKFSVPLFFMISGALMLNRPPEPLRKLWYKRILRIFLVLLFWSFFYYIVQLYQEKWDFDIKTFILKLYDSNWNGSFWYLYAYIPMLMTLPFLQKFAKSMDKQDFIYLIILVFGFSSLLPIMQYVLWQGRHNLNGNFRIAWLCSNIFLYPCTGYFLENDLKNFWSKKRILILWLFNIVTISLSAYMTYLKSNVTGVLDESNSQDFYNTFVLINSIAIFVTCKWLVEKCKIPRWLERVIVSMGGGDLWNLLVTYFYNGYNKRLMGAFLR